jgi:flagellar basal-body rod protein FlgB
MYDQLEIFRMSHGLARFAAARQTAVAQNVANVNTPGYRQVDVPSFAQAHAASLLPGPEAAAQPRVSRAGHLGPGGASPAPPEPRVVRDARVAPNGNSVSLEGEIVKAAEIRQDHDMALSVYQSALSILRASLGRR